MAWRWTVPMLALALALALRGAGLRVAFGGEEAPPVDDLALRVDSAIQRGVGWLLTKQERNGAFASEAGETALALLALRHSGVGPGHEACLRAARHLERALPDGTVYGASLGILALLEQPAADHRGTIEKLVTALARGQCRNGQWTYAYRSTARKKSGDNSNTQLAALALGAARARRYAVPAEVFARLAAYLRETQNEDGGFGYSHNQRSRSYGSMTAGCAMALALCAAAENGATLPDATVAQRTEVRRALDWLAADFDPARNRDAGRAFGRKRGNRGDSFWLHYWLWSLERACSVTATERLGERDWYAEGARFLLGRQKQEGSWRDPESDVRATCFALLFLSRSTRRAVTPRPEDATLTPGGG